MSQQWAGMSQHEVKMRQLSKHQAAMIQRHGSVDSGHSGIDCARAVMSQQKSESDPCSPEPAATQI